MYCTAWGRKVQVLTRNLDSQVSEAIIIEIRRRRRPSEEVLRVWEIRYASAVLMEHLIAGRRQPVCCAVQNVHDTRPAGSPNGLSRGPYRQVGKAVAIEVTCRKRKAKDVRGLGRFLHPGAVLMEYLTALRR